MENKIKSISENQVTIGGKDYQFTYNLEKMKIMEKVYKVNIIEELSQGAKALSISILEAMFCQGIIAEQSKKEALFSEAITEHTYVKMLEFLITTVVNQMVFLFQKSC